MTSEPKVTWLYVGTTGHDAKGKRLVGFYRPSDRRVFTLGEGRWSQRLAVGAWYELTLAPDDEGNYDEGTGRIWVSGSKGPRFVEVEQDPDEYSQVVLRHRAEELAIAAAKAERKAARSLDLSCLEPLRTVYRQSLPDRQRAIEVLVLHYLRRRG